LIAKVEAGTLKLDPETMHPEKDTNPTGAWELRGESVGGVSQVHSHSPDGRWLGTLTRDRLMDVRRRWEGRRKQGAPSFEWEISQGFMRHKPNAILKGGEKVKLTNHWATPYNIRQAIMDGYNVTDEMFASFLNYHMEIGRYYSAATEDVPLGTWYDAFSSNLQGLSVYMNPEYEWKELYKALKWAIAASQSDEPFSAVLVYPRWRNAPYMNLLRHENVRLIAKFSRDSFAFMEPTHWETGPGDPSVGTAKRQVMVIGVANPRGLAAFQTQDADAKIISEAVSLGARLVTHADRAFEVGFRTRTRVKPPRGYTRAKRTAPPHRPRKARPATAPLPSGRGTDCTHTHKHPGIHGRLQD
jgi:hypothetical protein